MTPPLSHTTRGNASVSIVGIWGRVDQREARDAIFSPAIFLLSLRNHSFFSLSVSLSELPVVRYWRLADDRPRALHYSGPLPQTKLSDGPIFHFAADPPPRAHSEPPLPENWPASNEEERRRGMWPRAMSSWGSSAARRLELSPSFTPSIQAQSRLSPWPPPAAGVCRCTVAWRRGNTTPSAAHRYVPALEEGGK